MPYVLLNCEGSTVQRPVRFSVKLENNLIVLRLWRPPSETLLLTMTPAQARAMSSLLQKETDGTLAHADSRS